MEHYSSGGVSKMQFSCRIIVCGMLSQAMEKNRVRHCRKRSRARSHQPLPSTTNDACDRVYLVNNEVGCDRVRPRKTRGRARSHPRVPYHTNHGCGRERPRTKSPGRTQPCLPQQMTDATGCDLVKSEVTPGRTHACLPCPMMGATRRDLAF